MWNKNIYIYIWKDGCINLYAHDFQHFPIPNQPGDGRMVGRCHLILQSAGSNPAPGMDVCSRSESALSRRSRSNQPSRSKKQTVAPQTKPNLFQIAGVFTILGAKTNITLQKTPSDLELFWQQNPCPNINKLYNYVFISLNFKNLKFINCRK